MFEIVLWFMAWILLPLIPAAIASRTGRSFPAWYIYGFFLFIIALAHSLLLRPKVQTGTRQGIVKICPDCAEHVKAAAKICRFCGSIFSAETLIRAPDKTAIDKKCFGGMYTS